MGETAALVPGLPEAAAVALIAALALLTRMSLLVFLLPGVGEAMVPVRIRMILVVVLTAAVFPLVAPAQFTTVAGTPLVPLLLFESIIGFALGFGFRVMIYALQMAGMIIAQTISLSQLFSANLVAEPNPTISILLTLAGTALFVTFDWHAEAVGLFAESYQVFPLGEVPESGYLAEWAVERSASAFGLAVSLSVPFLLIGFLYNVVLGLINQAMPQMMVTFIGVPANVLAGLALLAISIVALLTVFAERTAPALNGFW